jgi:hypothetical protein
MHVHVTAFWDTGSCILVEIDRRLIVLTMEEVSTSETSVSMYQTTQCNNPEDNHIHSRRRENLKSHASFCIYYLS